MVVDSGFLTYIFYVARGKIVRNIILRSLNAENVSDSLFLEEVYVLCTFEIRSNKNVISNV